MTKLSNSISVAEMMHMRNEEGLSNGEIAKRLGIHISTVIKYIGKHPDGKRARRKPKNLPVLTEKTEVPEMPKKSFAERCEEVLHKPDTEKKKVVLAENLVLPERTYAPDCDIRRFSVLPKVETAKKPSCARLKIRSLPISLN